MIPQSIALVYFEHFGNLTNMVVESEIKIVKIQILIARNPKNE